MTKQTKKCGNCKEIFDVNNFYIQNKKYIKKDGSISIYPRYSYYCKKCDVKQATKHKEKESYKKWSKEYRSSKEYRDRLNKRRRSSPKYRINSMLSNAKQRAKKYNVNFNLKKEDIFIPKNCPILEQPLKWGKKGSYEFTPSLDRVNPKKGYTKDNIQIISKKANSMKNSATKEEMSIFIKNIIKYLDINVEDIVRAIEKNESIESKDKEPLR